MKITRKNLAEECFQMATHGGYVLMFTKRVAHDIPELTWLEFCNALRDNGYGMCGYADEAVRRAFGR